jgi:hypothetical protein
MNPTDLLAERTHGCPAFGVGDGISLIVSRADGGDRRQTSRDRSARVGHHSSRAGCTVSIEHLGGQGLAGD